MNKIIVIGLHGFLGSRLMELNNQFGITDINRRGLVAANNFVKKTIKADITNKKNILKAISEAEGESVLHLAGKTHIDRCQKDYKLGIESDSWKINVMGTRNVAEACRISAKKLIYLSTECVFDGKKGNYSESDKPNPINWYGYTKYMGEKAVIKSGPDNIVIRSVLAYGHPVFSQYDPLSTTLKNLLSGKNLKFVSDQKLSYTHIDDLVWALFRILNRPIPGIYHFAGPQNLTPYEFAGQVNKSFNLNSTLTPITLKEYFGKNSEIRLKNATLVSEKYRREYKIEGLKLSKVLAKIKYPLRLKE